MTASDLQFDQLGLPSNILQAVTDLGYETPSPIQREAIPTLMQGGDIIGQAQTGTGKTAAFALPVLAQIDPKANHTQVLILAPTRELAIQVAEACQSYAKHLNNFHVLPIYGGQSYSTQLRQLKRGAQIVVGTPGRVMDHMRRGTLSIDKLSTLVLDEADEMLRMGFIDDVEWVLEHTPPTRQIALFSATMPKEIEKVANKHLSNPTHIKIKSTTTTAKTIRQRYWQVSGIHKLDALTRILEMEEFDGIIIFVRTKVATEELAAKLNARGFSSAALNGDIPQAAREKTVDRLKKGQIDILIGTDVVARGLDVERISHVINYDVPYDSEAYVHRIGRTGRAGRLGDAILFIVPRERRMLHVIEKATGQKIERMDIPTAQDINKARVEQFKHKISECLDQQDVSFYQGIIQEYIEEHDADPIQIAAALAHIKQGKHPFLLNPEADRKVNETRERPDRRSRKEKEGSSEMRPLRDHPEIALERFRINVGYRDGAKPSQIVGAIANTADMSSEYIGQIEIFDSHSTVDLPEGMPTALLKVLQKARVASKPMDIRRMSDKAPSPTDELKRTPSKKRRKDNDAKPRKRQAKRG